MCASEAEVLLTAHPTRSFRALLHLEEAAELLADTNVETEVFESCLRLLAAAIVIQDAAEAAHRVTQSPLPAGRDPSIFRRDLQDEGDAVTHLLMASRLLERDVRQYRELPFMHGAVPEAAVIFAGEAIAVTDAMAALTPENEQVFRVLVAACTFERTEDYHDLAHGAVALAPLEVVHRRDTWRTRAGQFRSEATKGLLAGAVSNTEAALALHVFSAETTEYLHSALRRVRLPGKRQGPFPVAASNTPDATDSAAFGRLRVRLALAHLAALGGSDREMVQQLARTFRVEPLAAGLVTATTELVWGEDVTTLTGAALCASARLRMSRLVTLTEAVETSPGTAPGRRFWRQRHP